ncbi:urease accessory protein UreD [Halopenitus sp. H-Gu1]|uniref:urease accessory protein UreD n=1 Tax=Halopenitus sp. H-Gu1 TaxID=3242697 RepID=UPI00359D7624
MAADAPDKLGESADPEDPDPAPDADAPHPAFEGYAAESVPQAAVGAPGKDGRLELRFERVEDGTALVHDYATVPFHVSGTLASDPHPDAATVYLQSPTGGIAQGDRQDVDIAAAPEAIAHVTTQSSTKVQSMDRNYADADLRLSVETGAHLEYIPEPTILHADARYHQDLRIDLAAGATAVLGDVVVPGRLAHGERFEFERYLSRVHAGGPDGPLFEDATHLAPGDSDPVEPTDPGVLGEFSVYGSLYVVAPKADMATMSDRLHAATTEAGEEARAGASELPNGSGVAVRALGDRAETVQTSLHAAWDAARRDLIGAPAASGRKY